MGENKKKSRRLEGVNEKRIKDKKTEGQREIFKRTAQRVNSNGP